MSAQLTWRVLNETSGAGMAANRPAFSLELPRWSCNSREPMYNFQEFVFKMEIPVCNIKDVARLAGPSIATVSHVTSGSVHVSSKPTARVLAAFSQLQYCPNALAAELARGKSDRPRIRGFIDQQPLACMQRSPRMQVSKQETNAARQNELFVMGRVLASKAQGGVKQSEKLEDLRSMIG